MEATVIDLATFAELREAVGDEFALELVDTFQEEAPAILAAMRAALVTADADGFRRAAHSLKSNGNTFGALEFANMARACELNGFSGDAAADGAVVDALDAAYATAAAELKVLAGG